MVNSINTNTKTMNYQINTPKGFDIHNASLNEVKNILGELVKEGKISPKNMIPLLAIDTKELSKIVGQEVHIQYYDDLWKNPNQKRDMVKEFENIVQQQIQGGATYNSRSISKNVLNLLHQMENKNQSFNDILNNELSKI